jgi:TfoX/Sxy family transcriptional regulator of competence genes
MSDETRAFEAVVAAFAGDRRVTAPAAGSRSAFGAKGLKVDGRIFAMLVRGALVVKLPRTRVVELLESGRGEPFDAGKGRPMKEWISLRAPQSAWTDFAREARRFVSKR